MQVEIINIGDELLIGQVINSNAAKMGKMLIDGGFSTRRMITISDDESDILDAIENRLPETKIIIFSGGLGPTRDDLTKNVLARYFDTTVEFNQEAYEDIVRLFKRRNFKVTETNKEQAYLPKDCTTLPNKVGTARGLWFEKDDLVVISLPGVPHEMVYLMEKEVMPRLIKKYNTRPLMYRTIMTIGIGESFLSDIMHEWELALPENMHLAYLPQYGSVRLRLSCSITDPEISLQHINAQIDLLTPLIKEYIFAFEDIPLQVAIGQLLIEKKTTLATAESCTGGYISHLITSIAGSSEYYKGSVVAYANETKENLLAVKKSDIEEYGAVSEQVIKQMVEGARKTLNTDYAIATSGIAGPTGGTEEKPVGTVWIAVASAHQTIAKKYDLGDYRQQIIERSASVGMKMLRELIISE